MINTASKQSILFITGAFVSHIVWENWLEYFGRRGFCVLAPAWPHKQDDAASPKDNQPHNPALALLSLENVTDHFRSVAESLDEPPIVIGHSLGGLIAQILVNQGYAKAGVAIHSMPPRGVLPYELSFLRSSWKILGLFPSVERTYLMPFRDFQYAFGNRMSHLQQEEAYERYIVTESGNVSRAGLTKAASIDFSRRHGPLLLTAGVYDNWIPAHLTRRIYRRYRNTDSIVDYAEFKTSHGVLTEDRWLEEAAYIENWLAYMVPASRAAIGPATLKSIITPCFQH